MENKEFIELVPVQGGEFQFGHRNTVTLSDFAIGKYPVTQKQWREIMGNNPSYHSGDDDLPVERVSWEDVQVFIEKLNKRFPGQNFRLPTEAEWEYAARGGNQSQGYEYSGSDFLKEVGWYYENSNDKTHPVGQLKPNELGLYDMSGNVWEWCEDQSEDQNGSYRVLRGGSWSNYPQYCRVSFRISHSPDDRFHSLGFRLAKV